MMNFFQVRIDGFVPSLCLLACLLVERENVCASLLHIVLAWCPARLTLCLVERTHSRMEAPAGATFDSQGILQKYQVLDEILAVEAVRGLLGIGCGRDSQTELRVFRVAACRSYAPRTKRSYSSSPRSLCWRIDSSVSSINTPKLSQVRTSTYVCDGDGSIIYALNGVERDSCGAECKRLHAIVHEQTNDTLEKASLLDRALATSQELEKLQDEALVARQVHCTIVPRVPDLFGHTIVYAGLTRCDTHRRCSSDNKNSNTNLRKHEQSAKAFVPRSRAPSRKCNDPRPHTRHDC